MTHQTYGRLKIGQIEGETPDVITPKSGALSQVPYAEPTFLKSEFHSPYYKESHRRLQVPFFFFIESLGLEGLEIRKCRVEDRMYRKDRG